MSSFSKLLILSSFPVFILASCSKADILPASTSTVTNAIPFVGPANNNANVIYYGIASPDAATGCLGDYYLNIAQSILTGPKTTLGWVNSRPLKGLGGAGSQLFSGTTAPSASLGNMGDYYLSTTSFMLYGAKSATGWGVPFNLVTATVSSN